MEKPIPNEFILSEYQQCFEHMRHYESIAQDLLKFSFTYYSAIITLSLGIYQFYYNKLNTYNPSLLFIAVLLILSFIVGNLIILLLARNRKYFIDVAHQVNSIRSYFIKDKVVFENVLPTDVTYPKLVNLRSSQFLIFDVFLAINTVILFFGISCLMQFLQIAGALIIALPIPIIYLILILLITKKFLKSEKTNRI